LEPVGHLAASDLPPPILISGSGKINFALRAGILSKVAT
jgi:hypothetical protein